MKIKNEKIKPQQIFTTQEEQQITFDTATMAMLCYLLQL